MTVSIKYVMKIKSPGKDEEVIGKLRGKLHIVSQNNFIDDFFFGACSRSKAAVKISKHRLMSVLVFMFMSLQLQQNY